MTFQIKNRFTAEVLFECEAVSLKAAVEKAVEMKVSLGGANLVGAYLGGANLGDAYLRGANLGGANLVGAYLGDAYLGDAYLVGANLGGANLVGANLRGANLGDAYLRGANLGGANLGGANLESIREDFTTKLVLQKPEVVGLYKAIHDGKIDGSCYEGDCCCFVGTIARVKGVDYNDLAVKPNSSSLIEVFFTAIRPGDTPNNNQVSKIVSDWIVEFAKDNDIKLPVQSTVWSDQ